MVVMAMMAEMMMLLMMAMTAMMAMVRKMVLLVMMTMTVSRRKFVMKSISINSCSLSLLLLYGQLVMMKLIW